MTDDEHDESNAVSLGLNFDGSCRKETEYKSNSSLPQHSSGIAGRLYTLPAVSTKHSCYPPETQTDRRGSRLMKQEYHVEAYVHGYDRRGSQQLFEISLLHHQ
jgi:hypothetical protein